MIHINKIAKQTKITVRTLRYYDQIGLLVPSSKSEGGHRLYTDNDMKKLQQIQFLKSMGFALTEIKEMLDNPKWDWSIGLMSQLTYIEQEQERLKEMERSLRTLLSGLVIEDGDEEAAIQNLIRFSNQDKNRLMAFKEGMFDDEELALWSKLPNMNGEDPDSLEWIALLSQLKRHMNEGAGSVRVQNIIRRMLEKQQEEFKNEEEFLDKLWEIRKSPSDSEKLGLYPIDGGLLDFIEEAHEVFLSSDVMDRLASAKQSGGIGEE